MLSLSRDKLWFLAGGVVAIFVIAIGYLFFVSPQYSNASEVRTQASDAVANLAIKQAHINELAKQNTNLATYEAQLAADQQALPVTSDVPNFLRTLQAIGSASGVSVKTLSVSDPTNVASATSSTTTTTPTATPAAVPSAHPASARAYQIAISLTVDGTPATLNAFLQALQVQQPRAILINSVSMTSASSAGAGMTLAVSFQAFMAPSS